MMMMVSRERVRCILIGAPADLVIVLCAACSYFFQSGCIGSHAIACFFHIQVSFLPSILPFLFINLPSYTRFFCIPSRYVNLLDTVGLG